ncbi:acyl-[ACP]--phospholipid O-acyltransferase [Enterovirga rhinocerotis]|uniref:Acyl-[acyl-carrier-protein]-phospholipid O-acyltransferase/long-chain-fatty-acid--[acyl-carrier-protein] ligase n=1 Tax=Enterovirga rhinocerotis TaxID=1339210 RepID=A0A4R7BX32_9HYPH|nr:acyl-[ACP]--phospholipid O-acyltransferase [Enterovirga rhinocerotis]TDR89245.1 acyl-[acyl-carrier-protein]-phospholipid O-acyltransferase/long-chain-fatty-acid--[acyl-carrier-protein] ligase [Enterovirga rhinocerotis]
MAQTSFHLLRSRRFAPLFWTQALGGFNDNLFKQAMALFVAYRAGASSALDPASLTALAGATFVAPFIFLSAFAGTLADTMDKGVLARRLKVLEIVIMVGAAFALISGSLIGLFAVLFLLGCQAALFGPVKYALLPAHLKPQELVDGNALVEGATFIAILLGSILGGALIGSESGAFWVSIGLLAMAAIGLASSQFIPAAPPVADPNAMGATSSLGILREARANRTAWLSILGISWFWVVGATLLSFVPPLARDLLGGGEAVASVLLGVFSVGIAIGSLLCARSLKGEISPRPVPFAALAMSALLVVFALVMTALPTPPSLGRHVAEVVMAPGAIFVAGTLFALAVAAGFYAVPLFAILQHSAPEDAKARMIGANNIVNSLMMVAGAIVVAVLSSALKFSLPTLALILAALNLVAALIMVRLLSRIVLKAVVKSILSFVYDVEVRGEENVAKAGARRIVVANHQSFLDGLVVAAFMPGDPVFAVDTTIAKKWWSRPLLALVDYAALDPTNPMALKSLAREVEQGRMLVIFPEGRLTVTGSLMKVYDGPGLVADRTGADLIPVRIDGVQHTMFTRLAGRVARKMAPKITLTVMPPCRLDVDPAIKGRARRKIAGQRLYDVMSETLFRSSNIDRTLFRSLLDAAALNGRSRPIIEDIDFNPLGYGRLIAGAYVLGAKLRRFASEGEAVGILLPNSVGAIVTFFALQSTKRVPAMLNVSTGAAGMAAACRIAKVATVLSSRRFVEKAKLQAVAAELEKRVRIVYLEDIRETVGPLDKIAGLAKSYLPFLAYEDAHPDSAAVVLFTSGSEGSPKGVVLTHRNLQANRYQVGARIAFNTRDVVFNALPMFHSFGLTIGTLLPILAGIKTFLYPSPLHYRIVPELIYQTNATVFFATDTFLRGYARMANPYDFHSVRIVGAGAERVSDETRKTWSERFGVRILEGYGATETGPVIAFNTPMHFKAGTVGRPMPGLEVRIEPVTGIEGAGRLLVKGPNVMAGYFRDTAPGVIEPVTDGWYDTGDIVAIDEDGFVAIKGRAKRFAKIAGEMVSLGAVEDLAAKVSPGHRHAAVARPDARKGEAVVLLSEDPALTREAIAKAASAAGVPEIMLPREVIAGAAIPVLGTGKTDYVTLAAQAQAKAAA